MGFELNISYYDSDGKGDFNREQIKSKTIKVGETLEEIPTEKVAATVMKQMAKGNILVQDVQIFEYVKKPLTFKESKQGLSIGGKKYNLSFSDMCRLAVDPDEVKAPLAPLPPGPPQPMQPPVHQPYRQMQQPSPQQYYQEQQRPQQRPNIPLQFVQRVEVCDAYLAEDHHRSGDLQRLGLTYGKQYKILEERTNPQDNNVYYRVLNDSNKEMYVLSLYFQPRAMLTGDNENYPQQYSPQIPQQRPRLMYEQDSAYGDQKTNDMVRRMDAALQRRGR